MDNMSISEMFKNKTLKISDYFTPSDIPKVYHYFDYYNLATLKNVTYHDKPLYGYAIIEIEEWNNNNSAKFFYNAISENKGKMVYDDPYYWDVEFDISEVKEEKNKINKQNINLKIEVNSEDEDYVFKHEYEHEDIDECYYDFYKKYDNSPQKNKKRKYSAIIEDLKFENNELRSLLIKKQKNYKKNNKTKEYKKSWIRRLRSKIDY